MVVIINKGDAVIARIKGPGAMGSHVGVGGRTGWPLRGPA